MHSGLLVFLFVVAWSFFTSVVVVRLPAGGRPAASHLFCFAKKGDPKKAMQSRCPAGARLCRSKNGERSKLAAPAGRISACKRIPLRRRGACTTKPLLHLRQASFLIHFLPSTSGSAPCEFDSKSESKPSKRRVRHAHRLGSTLSIIFCCIFLSIGAHGAPYFSAVGTISSVGAISCT
jgi:hypothetical protein